MRRNLVSLEKRTCLLLANGYMSQWADENLLAFRLCRSRQISRVHLATHAVQAFVKPFRT